MARLNVSCSDELHAKCKRAAEEMELSLSAYVRLVLQRAIENRVPHEPAERRPYVEEKEDESVATDADANAGDTGSLADSPSPAGDFLDRLDDELGL